MEGGEVLESEQDAIPLASFGQAPVGGFPKEVATRVTLALHQDARGTLQSFDFEALPFVPRRVFSVAAPPEGSRRGGHAHRSARQILVCLAGAVDVTLRASEAESRVRLVPDGHALLIEPGVWAEQRYQAGESLLLVLSSEPYDPSDYLNDPA